MSNPFANRIVGYVVKPASELTANPLNYRKHPAKQRAAVQASLRELGWIAAVIENVRTGLLVDGHERVMQAMAKGETVPVLQVDLSPEEEALALATFDPITYMAETDAAALDALLRQVNTGEESLQALLAEMADNAGLDYGKAEAVEDVEPQIDRAEELRSKWGVEPGQMWQLGDHRLICGDCTDAAVVGRVMGGEKIRCVWTDPPYGVSYGDKNKFLNSLDGGKRIQTAIEHDHMSEADTEKLTADALRLAVANADIAASCYVACPPGTLLPHFIAAVADSGFAYKHSLVWVKNQFVFGRCDYHYKHEVILYGWIENGAHYFVDDHTKCSVIEVNKPRSSTEHPTMKPVELVTAMIENSTRKTEIVYEPFSGSGTTIIACEQLGRRCRAVEISPGYVAVALERWATATGKTPVLIQGE